jgi:mannosyltransferase OCH1-like enzyme
VEKCAESWRRYLPDFHHIEWDEQRFDVSVVPYTRAAYERGMWAFVTDYVRLWSLYHYGGIYVDADVEIIQPLDKFLGHRAFTGHETDTLMVTATMGAEAKHPWIKMLLDYYETATFDPRETNTKVITRLSEPLIESQDGPTTYLENGVVIYPVDVFCPFDHMRLRPMPTANTHAIHWFAGSWTSRGKTQ